MKNFTGHDADTRAMSIFARPFDCLPAFLLKIKKIQSDLFAEFPFYPAGDQVQDDLSRGADDRLIQMAALHMSLLIPCGEMSMQIGLSVLSVRVPVRETIS